MPVSLIEQGTNVIQRNIVNYQLPIGPVGHGKVEDQRGQGNEEEEETKSFATEVQCTRRF